MDNDVERPIQRVLFRQSSLETRLSPVHLSEESGSEDEEPKTLKSLPKVVEVIEKPKHSIKIKTEDTTFKINTNHKEEIEDENTGKTIEEVDIDGKFKDSETKGTIDGNIPEETTEENRTAKINEGDNTARTIEENNTAKIIEEDSTAKTIEKDNTVKTIEENNTAKTIEEDTVKGKTEEVNTREMKASQKYGEYSVAQIKGLTFSKMASPRPKSPRPTVGSKNEKEESFWDKIGTLGRKKRIKEVQEVQAEGKYAIDSPGRPTNPDYPPEEYTLEDNEERSMIEPKSFEDRKLLDLITILIDWINDELAQQRIIVKNLEEDLYDGQVLQKLLENLTGDKLDVPEVTQSEEGQRQKLSIVLAHVNRVLGLQRFPHNKWNVESVHSKNIVAILHLLVALVRHFRAPIRLPENVSVTVVVVRKTGGQLDPRVVKEEITSVYDDVGMRCERDAFDTLFDHAPEKLQVVKKSLVTFVNKHLSKLNLEVNDLDSQFHDGVYLTLLMGLLEGFFVPLHSFYLTPQDFEQKVHNVAFAFDLMEDVGLPKPKARPEDIVNLDLKSTLRVLYNLFTKYKNIM